MGLCSHGRCAVHGRGLELNDPCNANHSDSVIITLE